MIKCDICGGESLYKMVRAESNDDNYLNKLRKGKKPKRKVRERMIELGNVCGSEECYNKLHAKGQ